MQFSPQAGTWTKESGKNSPSLERWGKPPGKQQEGGRGALQRLKALQVRRGTNAKEGRGRSKIPNQGRTRTRGGLHLLSDSSHLNALQPGARYQQPCGLGYTLAFSISNPEASSTIYTLIKKQCSWCANTASTQFSESPFQIRLSSL